MAEVPKLGTGGAFWILMIAVAAVGLFYILLWGFAEDNFRAIAVGNIFSLILIFGMIILVILSFLVLGKNLLFPKETFGMAALSFWSGAGTWTLISFLSAGGPQAIIFSSMTISTQTMLSSVAQQMPAFWNFFVTVITAPIVEEIFFLLALPLIIFYLMDAISKTIPITGNKFLQFAVILAIVPVTFAAFHTGQAALIGFFFVAMIFRGIQLFLYWGDHFFDAMPYVTILAPFAIGAHMANNFWVTGTLSENLALLMSEPFGWVILGIFGILIVVPLVEFMGGRE